MAVILAGGAVAAVETDTVGSLGQGVWWSLSLLTTVGFIGSPPSTVLGAVLSCLLMVGGFFLLALVGAALASLFVREDERQWHGLERVDLDEVLDELREVRAQLEDLRRLKSPADAGTG